MYHPRHARSLRKRAPRRTRPRCLPKGVSRLVEVALDIPELKADAPLDVVTYFNLLGWELKSAEQLNFSDFEPAPGTWWLLAPNDELCLEWFGYLQLDQLVADWHQYGPVHLHWNFVLQTLKHLYRESSQTVQSEVREWVEKGGRYPPSICQAVSSWKCPENWLEEVVALAPPRFLLREAFGEVDAIRQELRDFIVMFERSQLAELLPQATGCSQLARRL